MAIMITYSLTITIVKISVLLLYRRIFDTRSFRRRTLIVGTACVTWFVVKVFSDIFQCHPFSAAFSPALLFTAHCINLQAYYWGITIANLCLDIVILCLPVHMVWKLKNKQKINVNGHIFAWWLVSNPLWAIIKNDTKYNSVCIAGIMRIVIIDDYAKQDLTCKFECSEPLSRGDPTNSSYNDHEVRSWSTHQVRFTDPELWDLFGCKIRADSAVLGEAFYHPVVALPREVSPAVWLCWAGLLRFSLARLRSAM